MQAQLASMCSSLNPSSSDEAKLDDEDELREYLPEVNDEQSRRILEEGALSHDHSHSHEDDVSRTDKTIKVEEANNNLITQESFG